MGAGDTNVLRSGWGGLMDATRQANVEQRKKQADKINNTPWVWKSLGGAVNVDDAGTPSLTPTEPSKPKDTKGPPTPADATEEAIAAAKRFVSGRLRRGGGLAGTFLTGPQGAGPGRGA